ncbi:MAG: metalloregulator ArsR/SmtB family transcription factor, partial [Spongiibacteraceae bacterium]|nr:metalloregulator ArsR/SmtB family transcription factor [Spongiibacteraceae bacterium]
MKTATRRDRAPASKASKPERSPLATLCKACGEQLRLDILRVLSRDSFAVQELTRIFASSQPGMSHHLNILLKAGLVTARNEGNSIFYQRAHQALDPLLAPVQTRILQATDLLPLAEDVQDRLAEVRRERAEKARRLFAQNARAIHKLHELIVPFETYGEQVSDLVGTCFPDGGAVALEVGPGEGAFLPTLAARFREVVALDLSEEMLAHARAFAGEQGLTNIRFLHGDTSHEALAKLNASCVVINMVLHHTPSPATIFNEVAAAMQRGGILIVSELVY